MEGGAIVEVLTVLCGYSFVVVPSVGFWNALSVADSSLLRGMSFVDVAAVNKDLIGQSAGQKRRKRKVGLSRREAGTLGREERKALARKTNVGSGRIAGHVAW